MAKVIKIRRKDIAHRLREVLREGRGHRRELTLYAKHVGDTATLEASGAIRLTINDILPTVNNSLNLPPGLEIEMGVTGGEVWPVSIDDVEVEEEDEVVALTDQELGFAQTHAAHPQRAGVVVEISNQAIDSASFDILSYVQKKFILAVRKYIASHIYSMANFDGINGPFSGAHASHWHIPGNNIFDSILEQMTLMVQKGFDVKDAVIVIDPLMEVRLKCTPIRKGEGRMIIQDGLCAGYPYITNNYFNTQLNEEGKLVKKFGDAIGIGIFKWWKVGQHGSANVIIDGNSQEVAQRNVTSISLNTAWSFTDLTEHINGDTEGGLQAFAVLYMRRGLLADTNHKVFRTSDNKILSVEIDRRELLGDANRKVLHTSDNKILSVGIDSRSNLQTP